MTMLGFAIRFRPCHIPILSPVMSVHASMYISCIPSICHIIHETQACCRHCPSCVGIAPAARWDGNGFGDGRECAQCMHGRVGACAHCIWRIRSQGLTFASGSMFPPCIVPVPQRLPMRLVCMALSHGLAGTPIWAYGKTQSTGTPKAHRLLAWDCMQCIQYMVHPNAVRSSGLFKGTCVRGCVS